MGRTAKRLRCGFTTGACAAAAAKAAAMMAAGRPAPRQVDIPFPDGGRHTFTLHRTEERRGTEGISSWSASVIKDAGDDPDVTNGAEIVATVTVGDADPAGENGVGENGGENGENGVGENGVRHHFRGKMVSDPIFVWLRRGEGVGTVTRPGLAIAPGEPAINPVPRRMIAAAVAEVWPATHPPLTVTISVPDGERLAAKTLNRRLGIIGGLSILGTTGIVRPISAEAWTATIQASLDVAQAAGLGEVMLSTGRTSEKGAQQRLELPEEACAMMGDYLQFALQEAGKRGFARIHLAGMWAKIVKAALGVPQTHVRHGMLEVERAVALLAGLAGKSDLPPGLEEANTVREIHDRLRAAKRPELILAVCRRAAQYAALTAKVPVTLYLVDSRARVVATAAAPEDMGG
ncbi:cobalt-precorrin-5B (C(1))-methyltransferase CbiD [Desulfurivibrio sp. D14AmB]|uniref:cobalt-precorrin-5B (C(1))-methyltransferase CbiD n=1 Tax=Desulfurivibrio sp. D14AmB TaxID=3374370 RepID=UPI00376EFCC3